MEARERSPTVDYWRERARYWKDLALRRRWCIGRTDGDPDVRDLEREVRLERKLRRLDATRRRNAERALRELEELVVESQLHVEES